MRVKRFLSLVLQFACTLATLKQRNGFWYITGKGCGTDTPIKYLNEIPDNIEGMSCVIIQPNKVKQINVTEAEGEEGIIKSKS